jgi:hypothetical protein
MSYTQLDQAQVIKTVYDAATDSLKVNLVSASSSAVGLFTLPYDAITVTYPSVTQEVYVSRTGGIAGAVVQTVTINYTDATKSFVLNAARS